MQTYSTAHEGSADQEQRQEKIQTRNPTLQKAQATPKQMTGQSYFKDMVTFLNNCRFDKRLSPATQLIYRVLCDLANKNYWLYPFVVSRDDLKEITHINSNSDIDRCKQRLKDLGYIDFYGKPSKFTIYSPTGKQPGNESGDTADNSHTPIHSYNNLPKEENTKEERVIKHDNDNRKQDWRTSKEVTELLQHH